MSVPLFWSDAGLPIGSQFVGRFGDEATLFRLAAQLEQARPWRDRLPPISAIQAGPPALRRREAFLDGGGSMHCSQPGKRAPEHPGKD
jgi:hypothetical protein